MPDNQTSQLNQKILLNTNDNIELDEKVRYTKKSFHTESVETNNENKHKSSLLELFASGLTLPKLVEISGINIQLIIREIEPELLQELKNLLLSKISVTDIAKRFDVTRTTVRRWIEKFGLEEFRLKKGYTYSKVSREQLFTGYLQLYGIARLEKRYFIDHKTVTKILVESGFTVYSSATMTKIVNHLKTDSENSLGRFWQPITPKLQEILVGELLGDGNIRINLPTIHGIRTKMNIPKNTPTLEEYKHALEDLHSIQMLPNINEIINTKSERTKVIERFNKAIASISLSSTAYFRLHTSVEERKWIDHIGKRFEEGKYHNKIVDLCAQDKTGQKKITTYLDTIGSVQLQKLYENWYAGENHSKIVPKSFRLTPTMLLHWYIGDGSANRNSISIYTDSFSKDDVEFLVQYLNAEIGIQAKIYVHIKKDRPEKKYYRIYFTNKYNYKKFFAYLNKADPESLQLAKKLFAWKFSTTLTKEHYVRLGGEKMTDKERNIVFKEYDI